MISRFCRNRRSGRGAAPSVAVGIATLVVISLGAGLPAAAAPAVELAPHTAAYALSLAPAPALGLKGGSGRIVLALARPDCATVEIDYRFVARFERTDATVVTDQRTRSREDRATQRFSFTTETFVGGELESVIRGIASSEGAKTRVEIEEPEAAEFELPLSVFPSAHTVDLIEKAARGETIVETTLFDGDNEAGKRLTTTALISDVPAETAPTGETAGATALPAAHAVLNGLRRWRISEAYYTTDSIADGLPLYETRYTLYENGVSDDVSIDTGDYSFSGALAELDLSPPPPCPPAR